jgi:DNA (cytosine-5)-methyltransferase 1
VLAAVDYDPVHAAVHEFNFPHATTICADASRLAPSELIDAAAAGWQRHGRSGTWDGQLDLVAGGPPCQGFSTIGKRLVDDERNHLVFHFFRIVTALRPRCFLMENVPGMMQGGHSGILRRLIRSFQEEGYKIVDPPQVLYAPQFGVPQARRRLFLLGYREVESAPTYPTGAFSGLQAPTREGLRTCPTVWDAIGDLPDLDRFPELERSDAVRLDVRVSRRMAQLRSAYVRELNGDDLDCSDLSYPRVWDRRLLTSSMRTKHTDESVRRFVATPEGGTEPISRFLRLPADGLCNTLRAGTGSERGAYTSPRPIHPKLPRVISVREAARLHSFPDWFRLHQTKWHGFRQVGNAVPPRLARAVAARLVESLGASPTRPSEFVMLGSTSLLEMDRSEAAAHYGAASEHMPNARRRLATQGAVR